MSLVPAPAELTRDTRCAECERRVMGTNDQVARVTGGQPALDPDDFCRWCARPISARAHELADNAAFAAFARMILGERRPAMPRSPAE